jgi:hypothetical protein
MHDFATCYGCANNLWKLREMSRVKSMRGCHASRGGSVSNIKVYAITSCRYPDAIDASAKGLH